MKRGLLTGKSLINHRCPICGRAMLRFTLSTGVEYLVCLAAVEHGKVKA